MQKNTFSVFFYSKLQFGIQIPVFAQSRISNNYTCILIFANLENREIFQKWDNREIPTFGIFGRCHTIIRATLWNTNAMMITRHASLHSQYSSWNS